MSTATITATTDTANVTAQDNVHYYETDVRAITFQVAPHEPSER